MKKVFLAVAMMVLGLTQAAADPVYRLLPPGRVVRPPVAGVPTQKALLVMIENGGYKDGLPFEIGDTSVSVPTGRIVCGNHAISANPNDFLNAIANFIRSRGISNDPCMNLTRITQNWHAEMVTRTLAEFIRSNSDFAIEGMSIAAIRAATTPHYAKVIFLQNSQFNAQMALSVLNQYRTKYVFDIHTLAHGSQTAIVGGNSSEGENLRMTRENFMDVLKNQNTNKYTQVHIRAVYQQNCYGSYLIGAWRDAGAKVVSGSKELNWMPLGYGVFLVKWLAGERFDKAVLDGYQSQIPLINLAMGFLGRLGDAQQMINDSLPMFSGDISMRIND